MQLATMCEFMLQLYSVKITLAVTWRRIESTVIRINLSQTKINLTSTPALLS